VISGAPNAGGRRPAPDFAANRPSVRPVHTSVGGNPCQIDPRVCQCYVEHLTPTAKCQSHIRREDGAEVSSHVSGNTRPSSVSHHSGMIISWWIVPSCTINTFRKKSDKRKKQESLRALSFRRSSVSCCRIAMMITT